MRQLYLILLINYFNTHQLQAQVNPGPNIAWQECYGGESNDFFTDAMLLSDGSIVVNLHATSFMEYEYYGSWVVKFDENFNELWRAQIGDSLCSSTAFAIELSTNNSILVYGQTLGCTDSIGFIDLIVVCIDEDGSKLWSRSYGSTQGDDSHTLLPTSDGGFLVGGSTRGFDGDLYMPAWNDLFFNDALIMKMDSLGEVEWVDIVGGTGDDVVLSNFLEVAPNQFLVMIGSSSSDFDLAASGVDDGKKYLLRVYDMEGNMTKENIISAEKNLINNYNKLLLLPDYQILIVGTGTAESNINPTFPEHLGNEGAIGILNEELELLDLKLFGGSGLDYFLNVKPAVIGGYYCLGITTSLDYDIAYCNSGFDVWIAHINSDYELLWSRGLGSAGNDIFNYRGGEIIEIDNMLYIFDQVSAQAGIPTGDLTCGDPSTTKVDAWLVALDLSTVGVENEPQQTPIKLYPNPASGQLHIDLSAYPATAQLNIKAINIQGVEVWQVVSTAGSIYTCEVAQWPAGIYLFQVMDGNEVIGTEQVVVE